MASTRNAINMYNVNCRIEQSGVLMFRRKIEITVLLGSPRACGLNVVLAKYFVFSDNIHVCVQNAVTICRLVLKLKIQLYWMFFMVHCTAPVGIRECPSSITRTLYILTLCVC